MWIFTTLFVFFAVVIVWAIYSSVSGFVSDIQHGPNVNLNDALELDNYFQVIDLDSGDNIFESEKINDSISFAQEMKEKYGGRFEIRYFEAATDRVTKELEI